jgi:hypothetical protein
VAVLVAFIGQVLRMHQHLLKLLQVVEAKAVFHTKANGTLDLKMVYLTLAAEVELLETTSQQVEMAVLGL